MDKSPDAFRTISEVAEDLEIPQHVLRFWETRFPHIKPLKRGGGRRYYRRDDVDLLRGIRDLLYGKGYTIKGVQRILKEEGVRHVQSIGRRADIAGDAGEDADEPVARPKVVRAAAPKKSADALEPRAAPTRLVAAKKSPADQPVARPGAVRAAAPTKSTHEPDARAAPARAAAAIKSGAEQAQARAVPALSVPAKEIEDELDEKEDEEVEEEEEGDEAEEEGAEAEEEAEDDEEGEEAEEGDDEDADGEDEEDPDGEDEEDADGEEDEEDVEGEEDEEAEDDADVEAEAEDDEDEDDEGDGEAEDEDDEGEGEAKAKDEDPPEAEDPRDAEDKPKAVDTTAARSLARPTAAIARSEVGRLKAALDELLECQRVLNTLKAMDEPGGAD